MSVEIPKSSVEVTDNEVKIASVEIANSLLTEQTIALEQLGEMVGLPPVRLSDVSLDKSGRVVITSKEYVEAVKGMEISGATTIILFCYKCSLQ